MFLPSDAEFFMASEHENLLLPWAKDGLFFCDTYVVTRAAWLHPPATLNGTNDVSPRQSSCHSNANLQQRHGKDVFVSYWQLRVFSGLMDMPRAPTRDLGGGRLESSTSKTLQILVTPLLGQVLAGAILAALPAKMGRGLCGAMSISAQGTARVVFDLQREQRLGLISTLPSMSASK